VKKYGVTETLCVHGPDLAARVMMAVTARGQNPNFRWRPRRFGLWANMNIPTSGVFQWSKGVIVGASSADATPWFHYSGITDKWTEETDPALPSGDVGVDEGPVVFGEWANREPGYRMWLWGLHREPRSRPVRLPLVVARSLPRSRRMM